MGGEKIRDQIKKLKFIHPMRTTWLINSPPLLFYCFEKILSVLERECVQKIHVT